MDEQSGESKEKEVMVKEYVSRKWKNWCQNEVDKEINGVGSIDNVNHNERSDQLFLDMMSLVKQK